jgi:lipopolysaccharide export system permease protein
MGFYVVPASSEGFNNFRYTYLKGKVDREKADVYRQINDNEFLYVNSFNSVSKVAFNFALENLIKRNWCLKLLLAKVEPTG